MLAKEQRSEDPTMTPSARTPRRRPARGPHAAQREDPTTTPSARTPKPSRHELCHSSGLGQRHHPEFCVGSWTHGHEHMPPGPSNCKSFHSHGNAFHISCGTCWTQDSGPRPSLE